MHAEARRDALIALLVAAAAAAGFAVAYAVRGANNLYEFCHYLDIARNWTEGAGYATRIVEPGVLAHFDASGKVLGFPYPVTYRFPLFAALAAISMKLLGPTDLAVALVSGGVHVLLAVLIFVLGRRLFDRRSALLAAALYVTSPVFAGRYAISGFADPVFALVLLALHYVLARDGEWTARTAIGAGVLLGLAYLARFNVTLFAPAYLFLAWRKGGGARLALLVLAAAAVVSPLWLYNLRHFGKISAYPMASMNLAAFTAVPDSDPWRYYRTFALADLLPHWPAILAKTARNFFTEFLPGLATLWELPLVVVAFALGLFRKTTGAGRRFAWLGAGLLLVQGLAFSPLRLEMSIPNPYYKGRYFFWFAPVLLLGGGRALLALVGDRRRRALVALFLAACVAFAFRDVRRGGYHFDPATDPAAPALASLDPARDVLVSNMAVHAAAYYRVHSIELPADVGELAKLMAVHPATRLYLDRRYDVAPPWAALFTDHAAQEGFTKATGFEPTRVVRDARGGFVGVLLGKN